ncbi:PH domain-containing protein [Actinomadura macrotermitis]|uniref:PH domain-containing protein n=1 Tax=Actinomadura macrotermitis TaxID=2585200 RepID=A0A7K0C1H3_9ACTN|nr:PH domain-containing protein [Actinomadura macrotermitis]MQY07279.1 hypothetical protein [Actinomadura macrotermitis]
MTEGSGSAEGQHPKGALKIRSNQSTALGCVFVLIGIAVFREMLDLSLYLHKGDPAELALAIVRSAAWPALISAAGVLYMRPQIVMSESGLLVRQYLRDHLIPWQALKDVNTDSKIRITYGTSDGESEEVTSPLFGFSAGGLSKRERVTEEIERYRSFYSTANPSAGPCRLWARLPVSVLGFAVALFVTAAIVTIAARP